MSYRVPGFALIHRARIIRTERVGAKTVQGERQPAERPGPWFPARRMTRRPGRESNADPGGTRRAEKPWSMIWGDEHENGSAIVAPKAQDVVEIEMDLETGTQTVRYLIEGPPGDFDGGYGAFGGQAQLVEVVPAS